MQAKTLIIGTTKGGIGKSILTLNVAIELKNKGINVRVADIDFQKTILVNNLNRQHLGLSTIDVRSIQSINILNSFLDEDFDGITLIDIGGFDTPLNRLALERADNIIIPFSGKRTDSIGFLPFKKILNECEIDIDKISIFLNDIHSRRKKLDEIKELIIDDFPSFLNTVINTSSDFDNQLEKGLTVGELKKKKVKGKKVEPKSKLQLQALTIEIMNKIGA